MRLDVSYNLCSKVDKEPTCAELLQIQHTPSGKPALWCNASLDASVRAKALIAAMTLVEKASNMDSDNFGVPRLGVPPNVFSEALHGMCSGCGKPVEFDGYTSTGCPTSFPQVISMGASWNRSLWAAVGNAVSDELRGLYSQGAAIGWESALFLWAPNINPFRSVPQRWLVRVSLVGSPESIGRAGIRGGEGGRRWCQRSRLSAPGLTLSHEHRSLAPRAKGFPSKRDAAAVNGRPSP